MEWKEYKEIIKEKIIKDEFISSEMLEIFNKDVLCQTDESEIIEDIRSMKNIEKKLESDSTSEKILVNKIRLLFKQLLVYLTGLSGDYYDFLQEIKEVDDYKELVYLFLQARSMQIENTNIVSKESDAIFSDIDTKIYNLCRERKNADTTHLRYELRGNNAVVIIISKMEDEIDLENLEEVCKYTYEICGKNIIVINTNDYVTENNNQPLLLPFFKGKDISKGIIIIINKDEGNDEILRNLSDSLNLEKAEHFKRMNACNIYFMPSRNF